VAGGALRPAPLERVRRQRSRVGCVWCPPTHMPPRITHPRNAGDPFTTTTQQRLTLVHFSAQLEDLRDASLTLELILSIYGQHPRVNLDYVGDKVSLS